MGNAASATDVTLTCSGDNACKDNINASCVSGDCILQCIDPTSCHQFGLIETSTSRSFGCTGSCPLDLPPPFSLSPTKSPSNTPSLQPSHYPTTSPTKYPTNLPSTNPTLFPSQIPTLTPSQSPTFEPTVEPSQNPTFFPSQFPSISPTRSPTTMPTNYPSSNPSLTPSTNPSQQPSQNPTPSPSMNPSKFPTLSPSMQPTSSPTKMPTISPSTFPTFEPSIYPSFNPTIEPTINPSHNPSINPTETPSMSPSVLPSMNPTRKPTMNPSQFPTVNPSTFPSMLPTATETGINQVDVVGHGTQTEDDEIEFDWFLITLIISGAAVCFIVSCLCSAYCVMRQMKKQRRKRSIKVSVDDAAYVPESSVEDDKHHMHTMSMLHPKLQRIPTEEDMDVEMAATYAVHGYQEEMDNLYGSDSVLRID